MNEEMRLDLFADYNKVNKLKTHVEYNKAYVGKQRR